MLLRGMLIGLAISAPVGPIGLLCIRRTLANGRLVGLASGLGAATADGLYGLIAGFGLTFITAFLVSQRMWLQLIGGVFLLYMGLTTLLAKPAHGAAQAAERRGLLGAYFSTLGLTITNPTTILSFVAIFSGLGIAAGNDYTTATLLVLGVFLGSATWWLILSGGVSLLRERVTPAALVWVNRLSGLMIMVFGVVALAGMLA